MLLHSHIDLDAKLILPYKKLKIEIGHKLLIYFPPECPDFHVEYRLAKSKMQTSLV